MRNNRSSLAAQFRSIAAVCVLALAVFALSLPVFAAGDAVIGADSVSVSAGQTADVAVRVNGNPGIVTALLNINYDSSVMALTGADNGEVFPDGTQTFGNDPKLVPYTVLWEDGLSTENHADDGVLVTLHFVVKADAPEGDYAIRLDLDETNTFDKDLSTVTFQTQDGSVHVTPGQASKAPQKGVWIACGCAAAAVCLAAAGIVVVRRRKKNAPTD